MEEIIKNILGEVNFARIIVVLMCTAIAYVTVKLKPYVKEIIKSLCEYIKQLAENSKYKHQIEVALDIWYNVEEDYRIGASITEQFNSKAEYFNKLLLDKFPDLKQTDLDFIRQAISGEINCSDIVDYLEGEPLTTGVEHIAEPLKKFDFEQEE